MAKDKEILDALKDDKSQRFMAATLGVSRNTAAKVIQAYQESGLSMDDVEGMDSGELHRRLFPKLATTPAIHLPDYVYVHKELLKPGVTLKLLWNEYSAGCNQSGLLHLQYSQFCKLYRDFVDRHHLTMHIQHKPGDKLMVDWAGTTMPLYNSVTGSVTKAYIFVGTLPFSMYCYAEACPDMKESSWINANIHMVHFLGGATRLLVPDNLKTGIISNRKHEDPVANRSYQEFAEHYHMALLPARVLTPKDKAAVEGNVGKITTHIIARLRNEKFFDLAEMNAAISECLDEFNRAPFEKRDGSRQSVFDEEELSFLQVLPKIPYEYAWWKQATVQLNYHIGLEYQNYSCPYTYARKRVDVRVAQNLVEIFYQGQRIASHPRLYGKRGQYSTVVEHMPPNHQLYSEWDSKRFRRWAKKTGDSTYIVIDRLLTSYRVEEQAYKGCLSLLKLCDKYGSKRLELACGEALKQVPLPRYNIINRILVTGQDQKVPHLQQSPAPSEHAFMRGSAYYGGKHHEK